MSAGDTQELATQKSILIPYGEKTIEASIETPASNPRYDTNEMGEIILTHGAGGDMNTGELPQLASYLAEKGLPCARFTCKGLNLKYRVKVYKAVAEHFVQTEKWSWFIIGGRSMGARAAVTTANESESGKLNIKGVICLSYPLHPPNDVTKLRDDILHSCHLPIVFISGTQDAQCEKQLMEDTLKKKMGVNMHWIEGGDHGLTVKGQNKLEIFGEVCEVVGDWCKRMTQTCSNVANASAQSDLPSPSSGGSESALGSAQMKKGQKRNKASKLQGGSKQKRGKKGKQ